MKEFLRSNITVLLGRGHWTGQSLQSGTSSLSSTPTTLLELTKISSNIGPKLIYEGKTEKPSVSIISFPEDKSKKLTIKCISFVL